MERYIFPPDIKKPLDDKSCQEVEIYFKRKNAMLISSCHHLFFLPQVHCKNLTCFIDWSSGTENIKQVSFTDNLYCSRLHFKISKHSGHECKILRITKLRK